MSKKDNDPLAEGQRIQAEAVKAQEEADKIQPTPTQEEADKAKLGKLDEDGFAVPTTKAESADKPGTYKTRSADAG
jgi:hypothetical protein